MVSAGICKWLGHYGQPMKSTDYFKYTRMRPDRSCIIDEWIIAAIQQPIREEIQADGRIRRWAYIESEQKYLRVILLEDGETVHNAFFDEITSHEHQILSRYRYSALGIF